jgi:hypothetical protein
MGPGEILPGTGTVKLRYLHSSDYNLHAREEDGHYLKGLYVIGFVRDPQLTLGILLAPLLTFP